MKVSLDYLVDNYRSLDGQKVETEGILGWNFENTSICPRRIFFSEKGMNCFWLDFDRNFQLNDSVMRNGSGKIFVLRGVVDTSHKGHMGSYLATIKDIDFVKPK